MALVLEDAQGLTHRGDAEAGRGREVLPADALAGCSSRGSP